MHDLIITGGTIVDGTGSARYTADIAIDGGRISAIGDDLGDAAETLDASGLIVTPGFVDIHTHYDGQATWDSLLEPSSGHGVTTVVAGNCGVGFAPVRPGKEEWLVQLMEGVEDIPGTALHEGICWGWESFPEYLDVLGAREYAIDIATYVGHGPLRAYVMGDRGARNEPATADDIASMRRLVTEAIAAGAIGFSSSRTLNHKARDGEPVPGTFAAEDELNGLADGVVDAGGGLFEVAPQGLEFEAEVFLGEVDLLSRIAMRTKLPVTFAMLQNERNPDSWRVALDKVDEVNAAGGNMRPQIAARPFGMMIGWANNNPFTKRPTVVDLTSRLTGEALRAELRKPEVKARVLAEADLPADPSIQFDGLGPFLQLALDKIYTMGDTPNYEPDPDKTVTEMAKAHGVEPLEMAYDLLNEVDGNAFLMLPFFNYVGGTQDAIYEMLEHPATVSGLSDGGAHCRMICDASIPTYVISHWARDRKGPQISLEAAVKVQTLDTAEVVGFHDRGTLQVGKRADINLIDLDALGLEYPEAVDDLPAGGRRLIQRAHGYVATIVNGEITRRNGTDTGARPGRLVRSGTTS
ncbi:MAG TPA: amidohydrolase family protein [Ilumatobacteraceae bacterium]|jgi:N-acyl-D-aspartate/D-glutamate deacylase